MLRSCGKKKYSRVFNSVEENEVNIKLYPFPERFLRGEINVVTPGEICLLGGKLDSAKALRSDYMACQVF